MDSTRVTPVLHRTCRLGAGSHAPIYIVAFHPESAAVDGTDGMTRVVKIAPVTAPRAVRAAPACKIEFDIEFDNKN